MGNVVIDVATLRNSAKRLGTRRLEHLVGPRAACDEEGGRALPDDVFAGLHVGHADGRIWVRRRFRGVRRA